LYNYLKANSDYNTLLTLFNINNSGGLKNFLSNSDNLNAFFTALRTKLNTPEKTNQFLEDIGKM